jgi:hypothetical protein
MLSSVGGVLGRAVTFRRQLVRKNGGLKNENLQNQLLKSLVPMFHSRCWLSCRCARIYLTTNEAFAFTFSRCTSVVKDVV